VTDRSKRVLKSCAIAAGAGAVLLYGVSGGDGDSAPAIAGFVLLTAAIITAVFALVLGDTSRLRTATAGEQRSARRLQPPGQISMIVSAALGSLVALGLVHTLFYERCDHAQVPGRIPPDLAADVSVTEDAGLTGFPPTRTCQKYGFSGQERILLGEASVPKGQEYLWGLLLVLSPVLVSSFWRNRRGQLRNRISSGDVES
jgi:hypothetical protein